MTWWIAAGLVWLGVGLIVALALGRAARGPAAYLRAEVDRLACENQELRNELIGSTSPLHDRSQARSRTA